MREHPAGVLEQILTSVERLATALDDLTAEILAVRAQRLGSATGAAPGPSSKAGPTSFLSVAEVARALGLPRSSVYALVRSGDLPGARRLGNRVVVNRAHLERWIEATE